MEFPDAARDDGADPAMLDRGLAQEGLRRPTRAQPGHRRFQNRREAPPAGCLIGHKQTPSGDLRKLQLTSIHGEVGRPEQGRGRLQNRR